MKQINICWLSIRSVCDAYNWCANRLRVTGLAENVSQLRALMQGEVRPAYARADREGTLLACKWSSGFR
ncbi:DUF1472 domain-containing protein [Pantoea sp. S62]|nr:DUF1472 domain-containing protein [Pantoea sp. S62]